MKLSLTNLYYSDVSDTRGGLITALKNMNIANVHDVEYMALYDDGKTLDAPTMLTTLPQDRLHYRPEELNRFIRKHLE